MKGDFSRPSGEAIRPYVATLHQQGRVWLDADWNDEVFAQLARMEAETTDVIGGAGVCAVPAGGAAFRIAAIPGVADDFLIESGPGVLGRAYIDGVLALGPSTPTFYSQQPAYPNAPGLPLPTVQLGSPPSSPPAAAAPLGAAIVYVEAWQRLITAEQDPAIREVALGGPDTTVRLATVAQVKVAPLPATLSAPTCAAAASYIPANGSGTLTVVPPTAHLPPDFCSITDPQSYTGTQNALYRVEIHDPGDVLGAGLILALGADAINNPTQILLAQPLSSSQVTTVAASGSIVISDNAGASESIGIVGISADLLRLNLAGQLANAYHVANDAVVDVAGGSFSIGLAADAASGSTELNLAAQLTPAQANAALNSGYILIEDDSGATEQVGIAQVGTPANTLTLVRGLRKGYSVANDALVKGGAAFFKWSSSNGSDAVAIIGLSSDRLTLTVDSLGRDAATTLKAGDLVEIIDDVSELRLGAGLLTYVATDPEPDALTVTLADPVTSSLTIGPASPPGGSSHPLLRRWNGAGIASATFDPGGTTPELDLGNGVQIQFGGSDLRAGDYWQFTARSIDGSIDALTNAPPNGITRYRAPLAVIEWVVATAPSGSAELALQVVSDCRRSFPSLTNALGVDAGIHVTSIVSVDASNNAYPLDNDVAVTTDFRFAGIEIGCDQFIDPASVSRPTCYVTVDLPYVPPQFPPGTAAAAAGAFYQTVALAGTVGLADVRTILWSPTLNPAGLSQLAELAPPADPGLLTRLTLKGNFIRSSDGTMVLDGNAFANAAPDGHSALIVPSGDQRRGGDFSIWFWLKAPALPVFNIYVANTAASTVTVYPSTATENQTPPLLISQSSIVNPAGIALDGSGNLYVSNQGVTYTFSFPIRVTGGPFQAVDPRLGSTTPQSLTTEKLRATQAARVLPALARPVGLNPVGVDRISVNPILTQRPVSIGPILGPVRETISNYYISVFAKGFAQGDPPVYQLGGPATQITAPQGIAVDGAGTLYVANSGPGGSSGFGGSILIFAPGTQGNVPPTATIVQSNFILDPFGLALDASGRLYVVNVGFSFQGGVPQILVFTPPIGQSAPAIIGGAGAGVASAYSRGYGIAVDKNNLVYLTNQGGGANNSVVIFNPNQLVWNGAPLAPGSTATIPSSTTAQTPVGVIGVPGTTFTLPTGIAVDGNLNIYVADGGGANRILVFAPYNLNEPAAAQGTATAIVSGANTGLSSPAYIAVG